MVPLRKHGSGSGFNEYGSETLILATIFFNFSNIVLKKVGGPKYSVNFINLFCGPISGHGPPEVFRI
jgi:hypothetical protein